MYFVRDNNTSIVKPSIISNRYYESHINRIVDDTASYAYVKISDGCDNRCSYCAIPLIRGPYRSRQKERVIDEIRYLLEQGKREIILVSQDSTAYGIDLYGKLSVSLLK